MSRPFVKQLLFSWCIALATLTSVCAFGQGDDIAQARSFYAEGQEKFDLGDLEGALDAFSKSFEAFPHFRTIFNIGLCYEKLEDWAQAVDMYQRYLDWPAEVPNREEVADKVEDLKAKLPMETPPPEKEDPPDTPAEVTPPLDNLPEKPTISEPTERLPEDVFPPGGTGELSRNVNVAGWVLMGTGVASVVAGSVLLGLARSNEREMREAEQGKDTYNPAIHDALPRSGQRLELAGWIAGGVGIGTLAAGATLTLLSRFKPEIFSQVSMDATVSHRGVQTHLILRF